MWSASSGYVELDRLGGTGNSSAWGVSGDGRVIVGARDRWDGGYEAYRWTKEEGMTGLGIAAGARYIGSLANAANIDGSVIVGRTATAAGTEAFRWTAETGMVPLGDMSDNNTYSDGTAVSDDGRVVVGHWRRPDNRVEAFRWTEESGMVGLGYLPGGVFSWAQAVSPDGAVVVGYSYLGSERDTYLDQSLHRAFRWTAATGMQSIAGWLGAAGVELAPGYVLQTADAVSADGTTIQGKVTTSLGTDIYFSRGAPSRSGFLVLSDIQPQLAASIAGMSSTLNSISLLIHGAHSHPISRRVGAGESTAWVTGDWGANDHGAHRGDIGLAEVGFGRRFEDIQINFSLGQAWAAQDTAENGRAAYETTFLTAEMLHGIRDDIWTTLGVYGAWGHADFKRGYTSAGFTDHSKGTPDIRSRGLRARIDWLTYQGTATLTPYLDLSHMQTERDAYSEFSGGFPAHFESRTQKATEFRIGTTVNHPIGGGTSVTATAEAVHRYQKTGPATRGSLDGLFRFTFQSPEYDRDWLRLGLGINGELMFGKASISLNVTTQVEASNAWLSASWQRAF